MKKKGFSVNINNIFKLLALVVVVVINFASIINCGGGGDNGKTSSQTSTISGTVLVPDGTPIQMAKVKYLGHLLSFLAKANAITDTVPLDGASVKVCRMENNGSLSEAITSSNTDTSGKYTISGIPKEDNLIVVATKNTKDTQGNEKIVTVKGLVCIENSDLGKVKSNVDLSVETTLAVRALKDVVTENQLPAKDVDKYQLQGLKTVIKNAVASMIEQSKAIEIVTRDKTDQEEDHENNIKTELDILKTQVDELTQKFNDLLSKGTIAAYVENKISGVTITVFDNTGAKIVDGTTDNYGWCFITVNNTTSDKPYTVVATKEGYEEVKKENIVVLATQSFGVNFKMSTYTCPQKAEMENYIETVEWACEQSEYDCIEDCANGLESCYDDCEELDEDCYNDHVKAQRPFGLDTFDKVLEMLDECDLLESCDHLCTPGGCEEICVAECKNIEDFDNRMKCYHDCLWPKLQEFYDCLVDASDTGLSFTGTFKNEHTWIYNGIYTVQDLNIVTLEQNGNSLTGQSFEKDTMEGCCTASSTISITGTVNGNSATINVPAGELSCEEGGCTYQGDSWEAHTINAILLEDGITLRVLQPPDGHIDFIRQSK